MPRRTVFLLPLWIALCLLCWTRANRYDRRQTAGFAETFERVLGYVERDYVEPGRLPESFAGAMHGLTETLDEHSAYFDESEYRRLTESLDGEFGGVGISVSTDPATKMLLVASPLPGGPAFEAGILGGDLVVAIEGRSTAELTVREAAERMRGAIGLPVKLTVRPGDGKPDQEVELIRRMIHVESVQGERREPDGSWRYHLPGTEIAYVRIANFGEQTYTEFAAAIEAIRLKPTTGLIVDLRDNNGGLLRQAVKVSDAFLTSGAIVTTRGRGGHIVEAYRADGHKLVGDWPTVVLVNHFTASAGEILAAALQDHKAAVLVGERTWGKGSVQKVFPLPGGKDALKLTVYHYWRPSNRNIHRARDAKDGDPWGVQPDYPLVPPPGKEEIAKLAEVHRLRDSIVRPGTPWAVSVEEGLRDPRTPVDRALATALGILEGKLKVPPPKPAATATGTGTTSAAATTAAATTSAPATTATTTSPTGTPAGSKQP